MITINMKNKATAIKVANEHFSTENNILTLEVMLMDGDTAYDLTGKVVTVAFQGKPMSAPLDVVGGKIQLPITSGMITTGYNRFQFAINWEDKQELTPKFTWNVLSPIVSGVDVEQVDILSSLIQQVLGFNTALTGKADKTYVDSQDALKADKTYVDSQDALKADKTYVDSKVQTDVPSGAKFTDTVYSHPYTHSADMITDGTINKAYTSAEKTKLSGIDTNANNYSHPTTHPPSIIVQDTNNRFVTDAEKSTWNGKQNALGYTPLNSTLKGAVSGIAELDANGRVPSSQLPSYVDDVLEYTSKSNFPIIGESGKIYISSDTNLTYRWSGTGYVEISASLALGETSSTAFFGDKGKVAYSHSQTTHAPSNATANDTDANLRNRSTHTGTQSADTITDGTNNKAFTVAEKTKLSGIDTNANNYSHPTGDGSKHVPANGTTNDGKVLKAGATAGTYIWSNDNDTITTINGKTGTITKADITALGIPAQDTVVDISGKADITYVDSQDELKADKTEVDASLELKVDKVTGKQLSTEDYTSAEKIKLSGIATGANNYTHPANHPASMITGLPASLPADGGNADTVGGFTVGVNVPANAEFTDTNTITTINGKTGAISKADITALGIPAQDTVYIHPTTHSISEVSGLQTALDGKVDDSQVLTNVPLNAKFTDTITTISGKTGTIAKADIVALGIPAQDTVVDISGKADITYVDGKVKTDVPVDAKFTDTVYTHPASHPASMITESSTKRFVSDSEKSMWNSKSDTDTVTTINGNTGAISKADIVALGIPSQDTNTTYSEITTAEIDTGTDSTLRTITARRLKYLLDKIVALFPTKTSELTNDSGFLTSVTKSDVGLSNVDNIKQMPISGGVLENYREKLTAVSASGGSIDLSLGNVFVHTPSGNRTYSITNAVSGQAHSFTLIVNMGSTVRTLTFPASVKWQGGEIPDMSTANKIYTLTFMSVDGGTTWLGMFGGEF